MREVSGSAGTGGGLAEGAGCPQGEEGGGDGLVHAARVAKLADRATTDGLLMDEALLNVAKWSEITRQSGCPNYEEILRVAYSHFLLRGDVVFDVGAHCGDHTRSFIDLVGRSGRVICFEPLPRFADLLRKSCASSICSVLECAVSDKVGTSTFIDVESCPGESGLRERIYNQPNPIKKTISVLTTTIDAEAENLTRLDYIKIDIEGGEIGALLGGLKTLGRLRLVHSIEYGFSSYSKYGHKAGTLYDLLSANGYVLADLFGCLIGDRQKWLNVVDRVYWDYFAVPREKAACWSAKVKRGFPGSPIRRLIRALASRRK